MGIILFYFIGNSKGTSYEIKGINSILCNGDETQKSWKPLLNTIFALRGSSEWFAPLEFIPFISVALPH